MRRRRRTSGASCSEAGFRRTRSRRTSRASRSSSRGSTASSGRRKWSDYGDDVQLLRRRHAGEGRVRPAAVHGARRVCSSGISAATTAVTRASPPRARTTRSRSTSDPGVVERLYLALKQEGSSTILPLRRRRRRPLAGARLAWARAAARSRSAAARPRPGARARPSPRDRADDPAARSWSTGSPGSGGELVVEFPDREDAMVKRLLARKRDGAHPDYYAQRPSSQRSSLAFEIVDSVELPSGTRALYHAAPLR